MGGCLMPRKTQEELDRLAQALAEELLDASDEEILAYLDANCSLAEMRAKIEHAMEAGIRAAKKAKLFNARRELDAAKEAPTRTATVISIEEKRKRLQKTISDANSKDSRITLAAREGKGVPDEDIDGLFDDANDLGLFGPDGEDS